MGKTYEVRSPEYEKNIPSDWILAKSEEICVATDYVANGSFASLKENVTYLDEKDYAILIRTKDQTKNWTGRFKYVTKSAYEFLEKSSVNPGDIVITNVGDPGRSFLVPDLGQPMTLGPNAILVKPEININNKFLNYFFQTEWFNDLISQITTGTAQKKFNKTGFRALYLPVAPEKEQTRIVDKLEELFSDLDSGVAELKAAQVKLTQYRQSLLKSAVEGTLTEEWREQNQDKITETGKELLKRILKERRERWELQKLAEFKAKNKKPPKDWQKKYPKPVQPDVSELPELPEGWVWTSLSSVSKLIQIGPFGSLLHKHDYISNGIPIVNPTHIKEQQIYPNLNLTVGPEKLKELDNFIMREGDIVIGRRGEMGRCAVITNAEDGWLCGTGSLFIKLIDGMNPYFYSWILSSKRVKDYLSEVSVGTTMQNLNQKILHSVPVPLCTSEEQFECSNQLAVEYQRIDKKLNELEKAFKSTDAQRKNILKDAFSGKLVEQNTNDESASELLEKIKAERAAREKLPKPKRTKKKANKKAKLMESLLEVLQEQKGWIDAQEAFELAGVTKNTSTDKIENLYLELKDLISNEKVESRRVGKKDQLRFVEESSHAA